MKNTFFDTAKRGLNSLYWRISLLFLVLMTSAALIFLYITADTADMYFQEASQKLNRTVAEHIAEINPVINDSINDEELHHTFHNIMLLNPSLEVYLVDPQGKILSYNAPEGKVKLEEIDLKPVKKFIADTSETFIRGVDPRNPGVQKIFSAAEVTDNGKHAGYIYVILASEEYESVTGMLAGSYRVGLAGKLMLITLAASLLTALIALWWLTRNLNKIINTVKRFQKGDHAARIKLNAQGELTNLAEDFNAMADTIVKHIQEIRSVEELRRELIANVSHDLRTPLASVQGYAETLVIKSESLSDEAKAKYTQIILNSTERIKILVDDLFELSKLETKQVEANFEYFSLPELLLDVAHKYELLAGQKDIRMQTEVPQNVPMIYADIALIDRVLQNLVDNALKHTPSNGSITIELKPNQDHLEVIVADTGLGIKEDELPYIFERYRKGPAAKTGLGLGLAIVKKILELHESSISVQSQLNKGTAFRFSLPTEPI